MPFNLTSQQPLDPKESRLVEGHRMAMKSLKILENMWCLVKPLLPPTPIQLFAEKETEGYRWVGRGCKGGCEESHSVV